MPSGDLAHLITLQKKLQEEKLGYDMASMTVEQRVTYVKEMVLAAIHELCEALDEVTWKSWTTSSPNVHADHMFREMVDVQHFTFNLMLAAYPTWTSDELAAHLVREYETKHRINVERQERGYDGITDKCPFCARSLDDVGTIEVSDTSGVAVCCGACGRRIHTILGSSRPESD